MARMNTQLTFCATDLRVIVLVLSMLIIIPLLTVSQVDVSLSLATQMVHRMAYLSQLDNTTYHVS